MSYQKQNFVNGQILTAAQLNHMEDGIVAAGAGGSGNGNASLEIGTVTSGETASATIVGGKLNLVLPKGDKGDSVTMGIAGATADGETDDTEALRAALNQSNTVIDGGNKKYKYMSLRMENVENLTVKNIIFWKGQNMDVAGCKNIRFENCTWEGVNANGSDTIWTYGIRLMERKDEDGNEIWCENIWIEDCTFRDIWYNPALNNGHGNEISGEGILPRSVHKLFIRHNFFTQVQSSCIHYNTYKKCGYAEITDNTFYLNGMGGVCVYAVQQQFPKVRGKISNNQFIGCGLGKMPDYFFDAYPAEQQGLGCAALLGGAATRACPYKWHFAVENNVFEDNVESSIEGPTWNPCIGNSITGQGAVQTEENCRKMEEKYHLDYKLHLRVINSVNFIYRNYYKDADGSYPNEDDDPIVYQNNTMGVAHVSRASYIQFKGEYNCPVIFTGNTMRTGLTQGLDTHFLFCDFKKGIRFENNDGIYPYFNSCTFAGDVVLDDILSAYRCDFTKANLITNNSRARFPETRTALYDPSRMLLENDQATAEGGYPVLRSYDIPETVEKPTDTAYDIASADGYTEADGYVFGGPSAPNHIDTGIQLLKDGGDFTIFLQFEGNPTTNMPAGQSPIMPLFTMYNASGAGVSNTASYRLTVGGEWQNVATVYRTKNTTANLKQNGNLTMRSMQLLVRRKGTKLEFWTMLQGTDASDLIENYVSCDLDETNDQFAGFEGSLYIGAPDGYFSESNGFALWGKMKTFQLFSRALSDGETAMLLYDKVFESGEAEENVPVYDIATDSHYSAEDSAVTFDGTFGIDTGVKLFADSSDFTVICKFRLDNYHDEGLKNFNFVPVLSAMNYDQTEDSKTKSPGFDIGLFLTAGTDPETKPTGGFVNFRNSWKFTNSATILNSYFGYCDQDIGVICIRKNGVLSVYDFDMQRKATLSGADVTTTFDGTLHIGENMAAPPLGGNNKLKGKVYECKVYDTALSTSVLENMFPNLYSNEKRTKGAVRCMVPSLLYTNQLVRYIFLEAMIDMGKYSSAEYAGKYPKAVGIRLDGVNEIIWCPTGSNTHIKQVFYAPKNIGPYGVLHAEIVNTGLAPGLEATVKAFRCAVLTEQTGYTDNADALDFAVEWDKDELTVAVGETLTGHVTYLPEDANSGTSLTLTVDGDAATAVVEDDLITVTGAQNGEATVEAVLPSGMKKRFVVKVGTGVPDEDPTVEVTSVTLDKNTLSLTAGNTAVLTATVLPDNATDKTVEWTVAPAGIANLSNMTGTSVTVKATKAGSCTVTATAGGKTASCTVTVKAATINVQSVTLNKTTLSLVEGGRDTLTATVSPSNATDKTVTWTVAPTGIVTVSDGTVTAMATGSCTVTAKAGEKTANCAVTVSAAVVAVQSVTLDQSMASLTVDDTTTLTATVSPSNATDKTVTWTVTPEGIVSLSETSGDVDLHSTTTGNSISLTAAYAGSCTVTATAGGKTATCTVTVNEKYVAIKSMTLDKSTLTMNEGDTDTTLMARIRPWNATDKTVTWSAAPTGIVEITSHESGYKSIDDATNIIDTAKLRAVASGSCTVTATAGSNSVSCAVTVSGTNEDVPGLTPVYKLAAPKTFVPANEEYIDTGIQLFKTITPKPAWTILLEVQCGTNMLEAADTYTLLHCMEESGAWPGLCVQVASNGGISVSMYGARKTVEYVSWAKANKILIAIRLSGTELLTCTSRYGVATTTITGYNTAVSQNLLLGCYQKSDGTKGRYWDGTLSKCLVYNTALTQSVIETWFASN